MGDVLERIWKEYLVLIQYTVQKFCGSAKGKTKNVSKIDRTQDRVLNPEQSNFA
jgi:hypothetical protein